MPWCVRGEESGCLAQEERKGRDVKVSEVTAAHCWCVNGMFAAATSLSWSSHSGLPPSEHGQHRTGTERGPV